MDVESFGHIHFVHNGMVSYSVMSLHLLIFTVLWNLMIVFLLFLYYLIYSMLSIGFTVVWWFLVLCLVVLTVGLAS